MSESPPGLELAESKDMQEQNAGQKLRYDFRSSGLRLRTRLVAPADRERLPRAEIPPSPISSSERSVVAKQQQPVSGYIIRDRGKSGNGGIDLAATARSFDFAAELGAHLRQGARRRSSSCVAGSDLLTVHADIDSAKSCKGDSPITVRMVKKAKTAVFMA